MTGFAKAGMRYGDGASSTEQHGGDGKKQRKKAEENGDVGGFKMRPGRTKKPRSSLLASAKPKMATSAPGNQKKVAGGEVSPAGTVHQNYRIATRLESQITPKLMWLLKNLQK